MNLTLEEWRAEKKKNKFRSLSAIMLFVDSILIFAFLSYSWIEFGWNNLIMIIIYGILFLGDIILVIWLKTITNNMKNLCDYGIDHNYFNEEYEE